MALVLLVVPAKNILPSAARAENFRAPCPVGYSSGQRGQTVNLLAYAFDGSNPSPTTKVSVKGWRHARPASWPCRECRFFHRDFDGCCSRHWLLCRLRPKPVGRPRLHAHHDQGLLSNRRSFNCKPRASARDFFCRVRSNGLSRRREACLVSHRPRLRFRRSAGSSERAPHTGKTWRAHLQRTTITLGGQARGASSAAGRRAQGNTRGITRRGGGA